MTRMSRQSDSRSVINTNSVRGMRRCCVVQALLDAYSFHTFVNNALQPGVLLEVPFRECR